MSQPKVTPMFTADLIATEPPKLSSMFLKGVPLFQRDASPAAFLSTAQAMQPWKCMSDCFEDDPSIRKDDVKLGEKRRSGSRGSTLRPLRGQMHFANRFRQRRKSNLLSNMRGLVAARRLSTFNWALITQRTQCIWELFFETRSHKRDPSKKQTSVWRAPLWAALLSMLTKYASKLLGKLPKSSMIIGSFKSKWTKLTEYWKKRWVTALTKMYASQHSF